MPEWKPPSASFSAGAITTANRTGVSSGTRIWRGVRAVSAARRPARVASAFRDAMWVSFLSSGGVREAVAGQLQVDVVERRLAGADRTAGHPRALGRGDRPVAGAVVQGDGARRADAERGAGGA